MQTYEYYNYTTNESEVFKSIAEAPEPHASWFEEAEQDPDGFVKVGDELYTVIH